MIANHQGSEASAGLDATINTAVIISTPSAAKKNRLAIVAPTAGCSEIDPVGLFFVLRVLKWDHSLPRRSPKEAYTLQETAWCNASATRCKKGRGRRCLYSRTAEKWSSRKPEEAKVINKAWCPSKTLDYRTEHQANECIHFCLSI
jgi:hypothetical protein